jgi:hypothetical protein
MLRYSLARQPYCRFPSQLSECVVTKELERAMVQHCDGWLPSCRVQGSGHLGPPCLRRVAVGPHQVCRLCGATAGLFVPRRRSGVCESSCPQAAAGEWPFGASLHGWPGDRSMPMQAAGANRLRGERPTGVTLSAGQDHPVSFCSVCVGDPGKLPGAREWPLRASLPPAGCRRAAPGCRLCGATAGPSVPRRRSGVCESSCPQAAAGEWPFGASLHGWPGDRSMPCTAGVGPVQDGGRLRWFSGASWWLLVAVRCKLETVGGGPLAQVGGRWRRCSGASWWPLEADRCKLATAGGGPSAQ